MQLWTNITLGTPLGNATQVRVTGLTSANGWHFDLLNAEGGLVQRDCTAPATVEDASDISKSRAQADIETSLTPAEGE